MRKFLIDTDTASDDAVAIMMALAAPDVSVLALTTVAGNVSLEQATRNALLTAEICGSDVPVFVGAAAPLTRAHEHAHWFHGKDGLGDRGYPAPERAPEREHAVEAILRLAHAEPGLTLVTLGPLTNVALALARDPSIAGKIGRCVVMGGAPCCEGNVTPAAEYNIWVDPEAARVVFRSKPADRDGRLARLARRVGAERRGDRRHRGARHGEGAFRYRINSRAREAYHVQTGETGLSLADPTAMAVALDRTIGLSWSRHRVAIESRSELTRGMTVVDRLDVSADDSNRQVWSAAAGEARRRHPLDLRLAPIQGYAEGGAAVAAR